jgi:hypothetical protein
MKERLLIAFSIIMFCSSWARFTQEQGKPVVFALNTTALEKNKKRIAAKDPSIMVAYTVLIKDADKALQFGPVSVMEKKNDPPSGDKHDYMSLAPYFWPDPNKPDGLPYIRKDGQTNPEVKEYKDKEYQPLLCSNVQTLALAYYFSGEKVYAQHAAKLLRVWFLDTATRMNPNLNFGQAIKGVNTGRGAGLIDTRHYVKVIDAIGLLQDSKFWTANDQKGMQKWFADFLEWMQISKNGNDEMKAGNNHGAWYDAQRLSMALFTENKELAKKIVLNAADRLDKQMDNEGKFPKEMERTISLHYTTFVMEAFFAIAEMADKTGIDLWSMQTPSGKSLKKGFDALSPYISQEKTWEGQQIQQFDYEEGYPLLMEAAIHFNCKNCKETIKTIAGDKAERLRINLLY